MRYCRLIIIVDNGSKNLDDIRETTKNLSNIEIIEVGFNSGVHALNLGISRALEKNPKWILISDDDTIINGKAIPTVLNAYEQLKLKLPNIACRIGSICLWNDGPVNNKFYIFFNGGAFTGSLIKAELLKNHNIKIREGFFVDQADFDFFNKIRNFGYFTVGYVIRNCLEAKIGKKYTGPFSKSFIPLIGTPTAIETPFRCYLTFRNATILLLEGGLPFHSYIGQIGFFFIPLIFTYGVKTALKSLLLGIIHGIFKKEGYIKIFENYGYR
jgi:GT2 family glycosyltransferase